MFEFSPSAIESSRFQAWVYSVFFSMVCLVSHVTIVENRYDGRFRNQEEWTTAALSVSMVLSLVASVAYIIAKKHFESSVAEGGLAVLLLIVWVCALPFLMDFDNHLAISGSGDVRDANLYVFSWVSFMCVLFVVQDFAKEKAKENNLLANNDNASKVANWFGLAVIAVVMVASASDLFHSAECDFGGEYSAPCYRLAFTITLGSITFPLSMGLGIFSMRSVLTTKIESSAAILALILHIFGIILLTLGNLAPATVVDNLFFFTWISFFLSSLLTRQCLGDLYKQHMESTDVSATEVVDGEETVEVVAGEKNDNVERAIDDDDGHDA